jgi:hypothetical protein
MESTFMGCPIAGLVSWMAGIVTLHAINVPPLINFQVGTMGEIIFLLSSSFTKVSVLLFYRRLMVGTYNRAFKWALWAAIGFVVVYNITFSILVINCCSPVEALWRRYEAGYTHPYKCIEIGLQVSMSRLVGALSVISDFYSVMLPAALLMRIKFNKRQRMGLVFIFGMGFL